MDTFYNFVHSLKELSLKKVLESTDAGSVYEHYLGSKYTVLGEVTDFMTGDVSVLFKDMHNKVWTCLLREFFQHKDVNGNKIPVFRYIGKAQYKKKYYH